MNIIICLDNNNGISFNNRRQSRDKNVINRIFQVTSKEKLRMNDYSYKIFLNNDVFVDQDFLKLAGYDDYCFCEDDSFISYNDDINKIIVYRWNRVYPSDKKIDASLFIDRKLTSTVDFIGNSHDKITEEIYE